MRVNVQLVEAEIGAHLWAKRFDKPIADLFEMQDKIVSRIANQLGHELAHVEAGWAEQQRPIRWITISLQHVVVTDLPLVIDLGPLWNGWHP